MKADKYAVQYTVLAKYDEKWKTGYYYYAHMRYWRSSALTGIYTPIIKKQSRGVKRQARHSLLLYYWEMKWDPETLIVSYTADYTVFPFWIVFCIIFFFVYGNNAKKPFKVACRLTYCCSVLFYSILFYSKPSVPADKWSGQSGYANWCLLLCFLPLFSKVQLHSSTAIHHQNEAGCGAKLNVPISISQCEAVQGTEVTVVEIG